MSELVMIGRCVRLSRRNIEVLITSLMLPIMLMLMLVYLFGGAIRTGEDYLTYVVPGVILLCAGFGSAQTAVTVSQDMAGGIVDRFRSLDVGATALLTGHVVASTARNAISTLTVFGVAFMIGFRSHATPVRWLAVAGILLAYILAMSWVAAAIGLLTKTPEGASGFTFFMSFLPYASSGFVPIATMPSWLQGFAEHQPITPVNETLRGLLLGQPSGHHPRAALIWCAALLIASIACATLLFRRRAG